MIPKALTPEEEDDILINLLNLTTKGNLRWGFQPPSMAQVNIGNKHYVLRLRKKMCRLTSRRDGSKVVGMTIERRESDEDLLSQLFRLATGAQ